MRVPHYTNAIVTNTLTAQAWNGVTGSVLVFTVADTLRLLAPVDVSGKGFRGGTISNNSNGVCGPGYAGYYYPNAFTPNGDGLNDVIYPQMVCDCTLSLLRIYNRWGRVRIHLLCAAYRLGMAATTAYRSR